MHQSVLLLLLGVLQQPLAGSGATKLAQRCTLSFERPISMANFHAKIVGCFRLHVHSERAGCELPAVCGGSESERGGLRWFIVHVSSTAPLFYLSFDGLLVVYQHNDSLFGSRSTAALVYRLTVSSRLLRRFARGRSMATKVVSETFARYHPWQILLRPERLHWVGARFLGVVRYRSIVSEVIFLVIDLVALTAFQLCCLLVTLVAELMKGVLAHKC